MDHQVGVRVGHRITDLQEQLHSLPESGAVRTAPGDEFLALYVFHGHPRPPLRGHTAVVQARNPGMLQRGEDAAFALEALEGCRRPREHDLQGHPLREVALLALGEPDLAHAPGAQPAHQPEGADAALYRRGRLSAVRGCDGIGFEGGTVEESCFRFGCRK